MRGFVANTDWDWFSFLAAQSHLEEVNFWRPSARSNFVALEAGEPFFFKLKSPHNAIGGFGYFARYSNAPLWLAWDAFGVANGAPDLATMRHQIARYRSDGALDRDGMGAIGCRMISSPVFFARKEWIRVPSDWSANIMGGKGYDLDSGEGRRILNECLDRAAPRLSSEAAGAREPIERYGTPQFVRPRLGQGTFRIAVTDAYQRACAVTTEHSLPVLDVAHIKPFADQGEHEISNGLLLRTDIHRLFDRGYVTVTKDLRFEVSRALKDDYENGKTYYALQGRPLTLPRNESDRPSLSALHWHQDHCFRG
jgi:putative restriction endonuclease